MASLLSFIMPSSKAIATAVILVVAGYHYGSYAGTATFFDCRLNFGPYGVYHTYKATEDELIFDIIGRLILGNT